MNHKNMELDAFEEQIAQRFESESALDDALSSDSQIRMAETVRLLPSDEPSLAWRSKLNERILSQGARIRTQNRLKWMFAPVAGLGLAGLFAVLILTPQQIFGPAPKGVAIEQSMLTEHRDAVISRAVAGRGLAAEELRPTDRSGWNGVSWEESDLEAL